MCTSIRLHRIFRDEGGPTPVRQFHLVSLQPLQDCWGTRRRLSAVRSCVCQVTAHTGAEELSGALYGADLVVIPAGVPRKPGMTRDDLFNTNAGRTQMTVHGFVASLDVMLYDC